MNFLELRVKPVTQQGAENFVPITFNINFINYFAPYKADTDYSVVKCEDKTTYICSLPYNEIKKMLGNDISEEKDKETYDTSDWYF